MVTKPVTRYSAVVEDEGLDGKKYNGTISRFLFRINAIFKFIFEN